MKITVLGATGMVGKRLVALALAKGYDVIAFGRNVEQLIDRDQRDEHLSAVKGYIFDEKDVYEAVKGVDAVISVLGGSMEATDKSRSLGIKNIIRQMEKAGVKRIIALGGMGVLNADDDHYILDTPDYPAELQHVGQEHLQAFHSLEQSSLDWTFVCPPTIADKESKENFTVGDNYLPQPNLNEINAGDLADFMLSEATANLHLYQRVGISNS